MRVIELETSRFPYKERPYMPGSQTTQGRSDTRADVPSRIAFRATYRVGTPEIITYAAQWLACTLPCRRFTATLADARARLGANVDRYSFTATDSHRLLLAGLPAHKLLIYRAKRASSVQSIIGATATRRSRIFIGAGSNSSVRDRPLGRPLSCRHEQFDLQPSSGRSIH